MQHIVVNVDDGFDAIVNSLDEYEQRLNEKANRLVQELAKLGAESARIGFAGASYDPPSDVEVTWEQRGDKVAAVVASGNAVLFIEFGAGYLMGYGHPEPLGYGPGTYPDPHYSYNSAGQLVPNWKNDLGWYYAKGMKTYGNPPAAAMSNARKELEQNLKDLARGILQ